MKNDALQLNARPFSNGCDATAVLAQQSLSRLQSATCRDGRAAVLDVLGTFGECLAGVCQWQSQETNYPPVQTQDSSGDSTTIPLIASCIDWAIHRRRKAAAKCHLRLYLQSFLQRFAVVGTAKHADGKRTQEVCAGIQAGEIVIFDKAHIDYGHLADLAIKLHDSQAGFKSKRDDSVWIVRRCGTNSIIFQ